MPIFSKESLPQVPFNLTLFKGTKNIIISRKIASNVLTHPVYLEFKNWLKDTFIPDETFFATIAKIVNIAQTDSKAYKVTQNLQTFDTTNGICTRATMWNYEGAPECYGGYVRDICQLTVQDLCSNIVTRPYSQDCRCFFNIVSGKISITNVKVGTSQKSLSNTHNMVPDFHYRNEINGISFRRDVIM